MPVTTSLKLSEALKARIAQVAAFEGKTAHAVMVETLQSAMDDALARQQFYAEGEAAYQHTLQSNTVFDGQAVHAYALARAAGRTPRRPKAMPLDASKPMKPAHG